MFIKSSVGISREINGFSAGNKAAGQAIKGLGKDTAQLLIVFSSVVFNQEEMLQGVLEAARGIPLIGCSTAGEIVTNGPSKKTVAVMAISAQGVQFNLGLGQNIKESALAAGSQLGENLLSQTKDGKLVIMLPDGLAGNGADIVRGLQNALGENFLIAGGAAGDDFLFKKTYEYYNDQILSGAVVGAMVSGDVKFGIGVRHGWKPIGASKKVTKSKGAILYELDNKPAVQIYEEYFGKKAEELKSEPLARMAITYPLGLKIPNSDEYLIRDPITAGSQGEITCAAEVPEGSEINLMMGSKSDAIKAARQAAEQCVQGIKEKGGSKVTTAILFNCIARDKLLAQDAQKEIDVIKQVLGDSAEMIGFYTYGEQAPIGGGSAANAQKTRKSEFCNETMVIVAFGE